MSGDGRETSHRAPDEVFGLLANDLRVRIVQALGEAGDPTTFSALREGVGERDSGKFNYHLGKLTGHFVTKDDDRYELSHAGEQVYGAILSGAYTVDASLDPFEFEASCPKCEADHLVAAYDDEIAKLYCDECENWRSEFPFPPANLDQYDREELPHAFDRWLRATVTRVLQGFCANCGGRVGGRLERAETPETPARARFECGRCASELNASPLLPVLFHPTGVSFFHDRGVDIYADPTWRHLDAAESTSVELATEQPPTAVVTVVAADATLVATVGADGTIEHVSVES